jgi:FMN phosphatase YigB (HAD superfamily)
MKEPRLSQPPRALLLDLGDTLFGLHPIAADLATSIAKHLGSPGPESEGRAATLIARVREKATSIAGHGEADLERVVAESCDESWVPETAVPRIAREFHLADVRRFEAPPGLAASMCALKATGVRICAVSNTTTPPVLLRSYLSAVGAERYFDAFVFSVAEGVKKPHPGIYESALRAVEAQPGEALFVGDRMKEDVVGPTTLGIRAVLTHQFRQEAPTGGPQVGVIRHLDELLSLLGPAHTASGE